MLTKFGVNNYKCLVGVEFCCIDADPCVIIGQNDSGKTSVLEAMRILSRTAEMPLVPAFPGDWAGRELVNEASIVPVVEIDAHYEGGELGPFSYHLRVEFSTSNDKSCRLWKEWVEQSEREELLVRYPDRTNVSMRRQLSANVLVPLETIARNVSPSALYHLDPKWMATPAAFDSSRVGRMDPDGFGLSTLLQDIGNYEPERSIALREEFCGYFPQFRAVRLKTEPSVLRALNPSGTLSHANQNVGVGVYLETSKGDLIRAQQASDGAILFLGLLALIHTPDPPKLLLIEEPEKGVYPKRLEEIVGLIRRLHATRPAGTVPQIVMTTHSPFLLSFFNPEEVTFLSRRDKTGPVRARPLRGAPRIRERLADGAFYLGELWYNLSEEELFGDA